MSTHPEDVTGDYDGGHVPQFMGLNERGDVVAVPKGARRVVTELDHLILAQQKIRAAFSGENSLVAMEVREAAQRQNAAEAAADALATLLLAGAVVPDASDYLAAKAAADEWRRVR